MVETLYKTEDPEKQQGAEYYQLRLEQELLNGAWTFFVREKHGWFNGEEKRAVHHLSTLDPEEGFVTPKEAQQRYEMQLQQRVSEGFVHSFSLEFEKGVLISKHRRI